MGAEERGSPEESGWVATLTAVSRRGGWPNIGSVD
jgi:hypothetical protein